MRTSRISPHLVALLCAGAFSLLWMPACNRQSALSRAGEQTAGAPSTAANQGQGSQVASASPSPGATAAPAGPGLPAAQPDSTPIPGQPQANELQPRPQSMTPIAALNAPPAPVTTRDHGREERDLASRERRLAQRQAALEARELRLRHREAAEAPPAGDPAAAANAAATSAPGEAGAADNPAEPRAGGIGAPHDAAGAGGVAAGETSPAEPPAPLPDDRSRTAPITVPAGTPFEVEFTRALASNTSSVGDTFRARVLADVRLDGSIAIPAGSEVLGVVTEAVGARRIGGQAKLSLKFTDLVLPSGSTLPVHASFLEEGRSKTGRDAATIGGSAAGGALLGRILGHGSRGTVLGALVGAAVGTAIASKTAGDEVVIPEGSVLKLKLDEPLEVRLRR